MSQFVRVNISALKNVNASIFNLAINNMQVHRHGKLSLDTTRKIVNAPYAIGERKSDEVDCVLVESGIPTTIGFKFGVGADKELQIRGDFWRTGFGQEEFTNLIAQNYAATKIHVNAVNESQQLIKRTVKSDGSIVLRYAM